MVSTIDMLDPVHHAAIISNITEICLISGVQEKYLHQSMLDICGPVEIEWVKNFRKLRSEGVNGLVLDGVPNPDVACQSICGALLRNFIDARTIPLNPLLDMAESGEVVAPTVLLIPNFYVHTPGRALQGFKVQMLYDLLMGRAIQNKPTVVAVDKLEGMTTAYGLSFAEFFQSFHIAKT